MGCWFCSWVFLVFERCGWFEPKTKLLPLYLFTTKQYWRRWPFVIGYLPHLSGVGVYIALSNTWYAILESSLVSVVPSLFFRLSLELKLCNLSWVHSYRIGVSAGYVSSKSDECRSCKTWLPTQLDSQTAHPLPHSILRSLIFFLRLLGDLFILLLLFSVLALLKCKITSFVERWYLLLLERHVRCCVLLCWQVRLCSFS